MSVCLECKRHIDDCQHVCPTCGQDAPVDGDGPVYADDPPTEIPGPGAFACSSCGYYTHDDCGDKDERLCRPCLDAP